MLILQVQELKARPQIKVKDLFHISTTGRLLTVTQLVMDLELVVIEY